MIINFNYKDLAIFILTAIIIFMLLKSCNDYNRYNELSLKYEESSKITDSLGKTIAVKDAEIVNNQQSIQDLRNKLFQTGERYNRKIKEVKALIAQGTEVVVKDKDVPYLDSATMKKWQDSIADVCIDVITYYEDSTVKVGTPAKDSTAYYEIDATIGKNSLKINEIKFIDSQYVAITEFKGGFFKRNTKGKLRFYEPRRTKVEIKHTNPYFENKNADAYFYQNKDKKTYGEGLLKGGVIGGITAALLILLL